MIEPDVFRELRKLYNHLNGRATSGHTHNVSEISGLTPGGTLSAINDLDGGTPPVLLVGPDAGVGAVAGLMGSRHFLRLGITTGTDPVPGGILAQLTYATPFLNPPHAFCGPYNDRTAEAAVYAQGFSTTEVFIRTAGDIQPSTEYVIDILVLGA